MSKMRCPRCGEAQTSRVKRRGFFQLLILPLFGYFPWECASCRFHHLSNQRGVRRPRTGSEALAAEQVLSDPEE